MSQPAMLTLTRGLAQVTVRGTSIQGAQAAARTLPLLLPGASGACWGRAHQRPSSPNSSSHQGPPTSGSPSNSAPTAAPAAASGSSSKRQRRKRRSGTAAADVQARPRRGGRAPLLVVAAAAAHSLLTFGRGTALAAAAASAGVLNATPIAAPSLALGGIGIGIARKGLRRWRASRRAAASQRQAAVKAMEAPREVNVVTFNIRGIMDRWPERRPLLQKCLASLDADVVAFQEVLTGEYAQDQALLGPAYSICECRAALEHLLHQEGALGAYASFMRSCLRVPPLRLLMLAMPGWVEGVRERWRLAAPWARTARDMAMAPFFGNSIATRLPLQPGCAPDMLLLGDFRAAQRVCITLLDHNGIGGSGGGGGTEAAVAAPAGAARSAGSRAGGGVAMPRGAGSSSMASISSAAVHPLSRNCTSTTVPSAMAAAPTASASAGNGGGSSNQMRVWLVNTHLDHADPAIRARQAREICEWMREAVGRQQQQQEAGAAAADKVALGGATMLPTGHSGGGGGAGSGAAVLKVLELQAGVAAAPAASIRASAGSGGRSWWCGRSMAADAGGSTSGGGSRGGNSGSTGVAAVCSLPVAGIILTGDLNAPPCEATHAVLESYGYRSASKAANGAEPKCTWPSGLVAPLMDEGEPHCADYVYVWEAPGYEVQVAAAGVRGDSPAPNDPTLYPSDHLGIQVRLRVGVRQQQRPPR